MTAHSDTPYRCIICGDVQVRDDLCLKHYTEYLNVRTWAASAPSLQTRYYVYGTLIGLWCGGFVVVSLWVSMP